MRRITYFAVVLTVIALSAGLSQRTQAQQGGGGALSVLTVPNNSGLASNDIGIVFAPIGTSIEVSRPD